MLHVTVQRVVFHTKVHFYAGFKNVYWGRWIWDYLLIFTKQQACMAKLGYVTYRTVSRDFAKLRATCSSYIRKS